MRGRRSRWWRWAGLLGLVGLVGGVWWLSQGQRSRRYDRLLRRAAVTHQLPPALVKAVVWRESRFTPGARGRHGELGLMQLTETAAQEWADSRGDAGFRHEHVLDPQTNALAGCYYLAKVRRRYTRTDDPWVYALADYNAGRGNVRRWMTGPAATNSTHFLAAITFPSTREYVRAIFARRPLYEGDFAAAAGE
ncbi:MAG: lytic transglycosylase domain-containing protein [Verrucomicrobiota bacterium]